MTVNDKRWSRIIKMEDVRKVHIVKRINRFVVVVATGGNEYLASINNTGRLEQFMVRGKDAFCFRPEKTGKTDYRLFAICDGGIVAIIDTQLQMRSFEKALEMKLIPWLNGYVYIRRNAKLGSSLIDYHLEHEGRGVYLEVKSAVLREGNFAMYPDCPTERGRRHIKELTDYARKGGEAFILFIAALGGVNAFKPDKLADRELSNLLVAAERGGVQIRAINIIYNTADSFIYLKDADMDTFIE